MTFDHPAPWEDALRGELPGLRRAHVYTPDRARDPCLDDGPPPPLVLQLYFNRLPALEAAASALRAFGRASEAQAMAVRAYSVPEPVSRGAGQPYCTYLVAYEGPAEDEAAWHARYLAHHPPLMARLPGIRELEIYTRVEWVAPPGWQASHCMQRNKVAFDSAAALTAALHSPVRQAMRADYARLPPFRGAVRHFAMATRVVQAAAD